MYDINVGNFLMILRFFLEIVLHCMHGTLSVSILSGRKVSGSPADIPCLYRSACPASKRGRQCADQRGDQRPLLCGDHEASSGRRYLHGTAPESRQTGSALRRSIPV